MAVKIDPDVKRPEVQTRPRRSGGWFRRLQYRIKLALSGNDDGLLVENQTELAWKVYRDYHNLGIVDAGESRVFTIEKKGQLNVRPMSDGDAVEYLVLSLERRIQRVRIYVKRMGEDVEVYDMRAA